MSKKLPIFVWSLFSDHSIFPQTRWWKGRTVAPCYSPQVWHCYYKNWLRYSLLKMIQFSTLNLWIIQQGAHVLANSQLWSSNIQQLWLLKFHTPYSWTYAYDFHSQQFQVQKKWGMYVTKVYDWKCMTSICAMSPPISRKIITMSNDMICSKNTYNTIVHS